MAEMVEVVIDSVRVSLMSPQRLVVLRQVDTERYIPIWVGPYEAEAITVALQEIEMIRPLTHDLLKNVFGTFNARIMRVEIVSLRDDIFYGNIVVELNGRSIDIDSRPSDAIALAVRARVPILVHPSVMNSAGIIPEKDIREQTRASQGSDSGEAPPDDERLSIFQDFLDKLDIEEENDENDEEDPKKKPDDPSKN